MCSITDPSLVAVSVWHTASTGNLRYTYLYPVCAPCRQWQMLRKQVVLHPHCQDRTLRMICLAMAQCQPVHQVQCYAGNICLACLCNARVCQQASALSRLCKLLNQWCSYGLNAPVFSGRHGANAARSSVWRDRSFDLATTSSTPPPLHTLSPVERVRSPTVVSCFLLGGASKHCQF